MAYPQRPSGEQYVTVGETNLKSPIPQHPKPYLYVAPVWLTNFSTKNTSEGQSSVAHSSSEAAMRPLRRVSVVQNFEELPAQPISLGSDDIKNSLLKSDYIGGSNHEPRFHRKIDEHYRQYDLSYPHSFEPAWWVSTHNPADGSNTVTPAANTLMTESLDQFSDFQDADCESEGEEVCSYSPRVIQAGGSRKHMKANHHQDHSFITPKISFEETPGEIREDSQTRIDGSFTQKPKANTQISDSDLESFQSISEPESDSGSWVNEPTNAELEGNIQTSDHRPKEVSQQHEVKSKRNRAQQFLTAMRLYRERKDFLTATKDSPATEAQPSMPSKATRQEGSSECGAANGSKPERIASNEIQCYCQGNYLDDDFRVPLPVLKIQMRNLRQQINEISEERKHYKETRERLQDQFYSAIKRKQEFLPEHENATILMLKQKVTALKKIEGDLNESLNKLKARNTEEKERHDTIIASYARNYHSLLREHTQLKEDFESLARAHTAAQQAKLDKDELRQKIENLKEMIVNMDETQTARFKVLEKHVCSSCSQKKIPSPNTEASATTLDSTELTAGVSATTFKKSRYDLLLQAYVELEQEHHKTEIIQSGLEETVSKQQLTIDEILLENDQYCDRITELTQQHNSKSLEAQPLSSDPSTLSDNDTTSRTIAKLNHNFTLENTRLFRAAERDATLINYYREKLNWLSQMYAHTSTANEQLTDELTTLKTAHQKLEKAHAIAQEAYKVLERSTAKGGESNPVGPVVAAAENPSANQCLGFMHGKGKEVNRSQKSHLMQHPASSTSGTTGRNGKTTRMVAGVAEPEEREGAPAVWDEGRREDDYATPGNSDVKY